MLSISLAVQAALAGGLDAASLLVVALLAAGVLLVWWASRPSTIARYAGREPAVDDTPVPSDASHAPGEADHADH